MVFNNAKFRVEAGVDWNVPLSQGTFLIIAEGATDEQKKIAVSEYITNKYDIKVVEAMHELLKTK